MEKCTNSFKEKVLSFLKQHPAENCYLISDLENHDLDEPFIDVWMAEKDGKVTAVLARYFKYYSLAVKNDFDLYEIAEQMKKDGRGVSINGPEWMIDRLAEFITFSQINRTSLAELKKDDFREVKTALKPIKATKDDLDALFDFQQKISEFGVREEDREFFGQEILKNTGRIFFIKEKGMIVSSATISAENSMNGMITDVATDSKFRGRGYATACVNWICKDLLSEGKTVLLFYSSPDAGKLYKKIGFKDINRLAMGKLLNQAAGN